jgi:hypothetical protein
MQSYMVPRPSLGASIGSDSSQSQSLNVTRLSKPLRAASTTSSNRSFSVDSKEDDRNRLCDAVLDAHFKAATQGVRLENVEEKAAKADRVISAIKVELAERGAQEAVECVKWHEMYNTEENELKLYRAQAARAEKRLEDTGTEASAEQLQMECLRTEVVERGAKWAAEREQLLGEIYELQAAVAERDRRAAGIELQMRMNGEEVAMEKVERCNHLEALAHARVETGRALSQAETSKAALAVAEEKRLRAAAAFGGAEAEVQALRKYEEAALAQARAEIQVEVDAARSAKAELAQVSRVDREAAEESNAMERERRQHEEAASRMQADARQAMEQLLSFVSRQEEYQEEGRKTSAKNDAAILQDIETRFLSQNKEAVAAEAVASEKAQVESRAAAAATKDCKALREELVAQSHVQQELHSELQALSSAAAAVRAVAVAKGETISELQANSRQMINELALRSASPPAYTRKDSKSNDGDGSRTGSTEETPSHTPFDVMSVTYSATGSHGDSSILPVNSIVKRDNDLSFPGVAASSPGNMEPAGTGLSQAAAFLNAAAARATAAASAVEAFMPLFPDAAGHPQPSLQITAQSSVPNKAETVVREVSMPLAAREVSAPAPQPVQDVPEVIVPQAGRLSAAMR